MNQYTIRPVRLEDVEAVTEVRRQPGVMANTLSIPSQRVADSRKFLENLGPDDHFLVADVEGRAVGIANLHVFPGKCRHSAEVGISVHDDFQGRGIGRALMMALLDIADNFLGLVRVELTVFAANDKAIRLYEGLGFEAEGRCRKAVIVDGVYQDVLVMGRLR